MIGMKQTCQPVSQKKNREETVKRHNGRNWYSSAGVDARANKHDDVEDKISNAVDFNIQNLFTGIEKELKRVYKNVEMDASNYDDEDKSQLVRFYYTFNKKQYNLEVLYRDEDDVINVQLFADDWYGHERDDFSVTTIDNAIKQIVKFAHYNTV